MTDRAGRELKMRTLASYYNLMRHGREIGGDDLSLFVDLLDDIPGDVVAAAMRRIASTFDYFPTPHEVLETARAIQEEQENAVKYEQFVQTVKKLDVEGIKHEE